MKYTLLLVAALGIFTVTTAWRYSVWRECRVDHSWSYCFMVLGK